MLSLDAAIAINPDHYQSWFNKGLNLDLLEQYEQAIHCFDTVLSLNPQYEEAYHNKAIILEKLSRFDEADDAMINLNWLVHNIIANKLMGNVKLMSTVV